MVVRGPSRALRSEGSDVDGLRALVALLGFVLDARALGERAVAVRLDARVVHEEVLRALVRRDEAEALLVAEPLHGACCHLSSSWSTGPGAGLMRRQTTRSHRPCETFAHR